MDEKTQKGWGQKAAEEKGSHCCEGRSLKHKNIYRSTVSRWELTANKRIQSPVWHQRLQTYTSGVCWFSRAGKTSNCCLSKALREFTAPQTLRLRIIALWAAEVTNSGCQETGFLDPCSFPLRWCTHHPISAPAMLPDPHMNSTISRHQRPFLIFPFSSHPQRTVPVLGSLNWQVGKGKPVFIRQPVEENR